MVVVVESFSQERRSSMRFIGLIFGLLVTQTYSGCSDANSERIKELQGRLSTVHEMKDTGDYNADRAAGVLNGRLVDLYTTIYDKESLPSLIEKLKDDRFDFSQNLNSAEWVNLCVYAKAVSSCDENGCVVLPISTSLEDIVEWAVKLLDKALTTPAEEEVKPEGKEKPYAV